MTNLNKIKEAIDIMCIFEENKEVSELSQKEILDKLSIFGKRRASCIFQVTSKEELEKIINKSAELILQESIIIPKEKLSWYKNKEKIREKVSKEYPDIFEKVDYEVNQLNVYDDFINKLTMIERNLKDNISALLSTLEEADELKKQVQSVLDKFTEGFSNNKLLKKQSLIEKFKQTISTTQDNLLKLIDKKLLEEPTKLYYYRAGSKVVCKVNMNTSSYRYSKGRGKEVRANKNQDTKEYPLSISVAYLEDFLYTNKVEDKDILIDERSVDTFYRFNNEISVNLTHAFVEKWWNYDCPDLYRYSTNKGLKYTNMLGQPLPHFCNKLIECSFSKDYIDEGITEEEIKLLTKGRENTRIYKEMINMLESLKYKKDKKKIDELTNQISEFDKKIQTSINNNKEEIINYLKEKFEVISEKPFKINDNFGLDCGFVFILTNDKQYTEKRSILSNISSNITHYMNVSMPYFSQSITVMKEQFKKIKEIIKRDLDIELYSEICMD